jgi:hypothetical protein
LKKKFLSFFNNLKAIIEIEFYLVLQALIWDIQQMPRAIEDPILAYTAAEGEINQIQWGATQPDWIGKSSQLKLKSLTLDICLAYIGAGVTWAEGSYVPTSIFNLEGG